MPPQIHSFSWMGGTQPSTHRFGIANVYPSDPSLVPLPACHTPLAFIFLLASFRLSEKKTNVTEIEPAYRVRGRVAWQRESDIHRI